MTRTDRALLAVTSLAGGLAALWYGFALEWDLLNYHLYNPHALVTGRFLIDVVPAQMQSFINPLLHLPLYLLFTHSHSAVPVFLTGAVQGCQVWLLYRILRELLPGDRCPGWVYLVVAGLGGLGPIFLNQLGSSQGDTLLSLLVLAALLTTLRELGRPDSELALRTGVVSGLLLGAAVALKLTMAIYVLGLVPAAFITLDGPRRWRWTGGCAIGGAISVALAGGPWFAWLWHAWDNPLFPYFNQLFGSTWVDASSYRDLRFMPQNPAEWLLYPWYWFMEPMRVWEFRFRDLRLPLLFTLAWLLPLLAWRRRQRLAPGMVLAWLFVAVSYLAWLRLFSIYRYLSVVELLAPVLLFSTLLAVFRWRHAVAAALTLLLLSQALVKFDRRPGNWEFQASAATALENLPRDAQILVTGLEPVAFTALWLPDSVPLIRIRANFMNSTEPSHRLHRLALARATGHRGPSFLLLAREDVDAPFLDSDLGRVGLRRGGAAACVPVFQDTALQDSLGLRLCRLEPAQPAAEIKVRPTETGFSGPAES